VNKAVDLSAYPNDVQRNAAKQLSTATFFRASPDDQMPTAMESAFWQGAVKYIQNPGQLDSILSSLESTAMSTYTS
jgi:alpha-glucoside transport system substrate-binding protein